MLPPEKLNSDLVTAKHFLEAKAAGCISISLISFFGFARFIAESGNIGIPEVLVWALISQCCCLLLSAIMACSSFLPTYRGELDSGKPNSLKKDEPFFWHTLALCRPEDLLDYYPAGGLSIGEARSIVRLSRIIKTQYWFFERAVIFLLCGLGTPIFGWIAFQFWKSKRDSTLRVGK